ncbi:uncharacterized protein V6R79_002399, partial [Siganus canaliculatus]
AEVSFRVPTGGALLTPDVDTRARCPAGIKAPPPARSGPSLSLSLADAAPGARSCLLLLFIALFELLTINCDSFETYCCTILVTVSEARP